ncbi:DUF5333 domain-containing protein [Roseobacter litoralis]|uniref:NADH dehydrogenase subunit E n=2 Tax=Roseobacter litoralis TaxID=42443 RepID=F7ZCP2_ROSLO|nr:DUF5333 domain-containing protein [Roseobacter litoralis]AEI94466.1 hypothetical protein RLO149_c024980 [Roseobacter litoralis Och 149]
MRKTMMMAVFMMGLAAPVAANPPLRDVQQIDDALYTVGLANEIRRKCPDISARFFKAISYLRALEDQARELGYSEAEIKAHLESDTEKKRLRARAADEMKAAGYKQNKQGYCALGRAEIAQKTEIGALLRVSR